MVVFKCKIRNEIVDISECSNCYPQRAEKIKEGKIKDVDANFLSLSRAVCKMANKIQISIEEIPNAVTVEKAIAGDLYRTVSNSLVRVLREINTEGPQIYLVSERDGSRVKISTDYILFSDIEKLLTQKEEEATVDTATTETKETKKSREEIRREKQILREEKRKRDLERKTTFKQDRLERKDKGTKTSHIDNLLKEGKELEEITKIVLEKFPAEGEAKIKRLIWSRRAVYRKSIRDGQHEQPPTTKDSTDPVITG